MCSKSRTCTGDICWMFHEKMWICQVCVEYLCPQVSCHWISTLKSLIWSHYWAADTCKTGNTSQKRTAQPHASLHIHDVLTLLFPLLKVPRMVLLSSLLWWELGTNLPGPGPGEWLSLWRVTSKHFWLFWLWLCQGLSWSRRHCTE